ncbi:uncharacterized protein [Miscanthus floridulus]|uniref:uncharacterized protein n=1 Tax=Miscanthus floridulus TaxID=154761 RepID=UPI00345A4E8B
MVLGASAGGSASQGGGGDGDSGQMSARPAAEADTPETRALGKRAVSPLGSTAEVEQATAGLAPPRVERAPESGEGRPALVDTGAAPPPPLQRRDTVKKRLGIRSGKKHQAEVPAFAPRKALKVGTGSIAPGVVEVQELVAQVGATQVAVGREEEEEPTLREAAAPAAVEATVGTAETPSAVEATEGEGEVEAPTIAEALRTSGAEVVEIAAPGNFGAKVVEAGVSAARAVDLEVETEARQASTLPLIQSVPPVQGSAQEAEVRPIPTNNASRGKGVADAGAASVVEQPASASGEGSAALIRDDPEGEPIFALEDATEGGRWDTLEQYRSLAERSLRTALSVVANDLPEVSQELEARSFGKSLFLRWERGVWDELCRQRELLAHANELLSVRSTEVEDLQLEKEASRAAEASRVEVQHWKEKAKGLDDEVSWLTEASVALQTMLDREIEEHEVLQSIARAVCEALEMEGVQSGVKRALAVVSSHYTSVDIEGVSDGYVLSKDAIEAEEELTKLEAAVEGPGTTLAKLFEEVVVPLSPSTDAGDPAP